MGSLSVQALRRVGIFFCTSIAQRWDLCPYKHCPGRKDLFSEQALSRGGIFEPALLRERPFFCTSNSHGRNICFTIMVPVQRKELFLYKHLTEKESFKCTSIAKRMNRIVGRYSLQTLKKKKKLPVCKCKLTVVHWKIFLFSRERNLLKIFFCRIPVS